MTAAQLVVAMPLPETSEALRAAVAAGGPWTTGDGRYALTLDHPVEVHDASSRCTDWSWAGVRGTVHGARRFGRPLAVELTVTAWSDHAVELALRPVRGRGHVDAGFHEVALALLRTMAAVLHLLAAGAATPADRPFVGAA
jgi:hypothetical protein